MKKTKNLLALFISLAIIVSSIIPVSAATKSSISVGDVEGSIGNEVVVPVVIESNNGFVSLSLDVVYDSNALVLKAVNDTGLLDGAYHSANYTSPYSLNWINDLCTINTTAIGTIVELHFYISEDAKTGVYEIGLIMGQDDGIDANGNAVEFDLSIGNVIVKESDHQCSFGEWEYYSKTKHVRYCDGCDEKEYKNHNWNDGEIIEEPSHDVEGEIEYTCEDCGATKTESIPANTIVVTGVSLNKTSATLNIGDTMSLTAAVTPSNATNKNVVWSSSNTSVASVVNGVVTANGAGTATITATTEDGGFVAECTVVVVGEKTIVGYKWYSGSLRHKVIYSDGTYIMEDCASANCVCGRQYEDEPADYLPGDINGDGVLDGNDVSRFMQYMAGWDVEVNEAALDVNGDGSVNNKDVTRLMQYNAGWDVDIH